MAKSEERKNSEKYKRILGAAKSVFAKNGFYNSRISDVAKLAGVADGTIYLYFENKDDLLISLFEDEIDAVIERLRGELAKRTTVEEKLHCLIEFQLNLLETDRDLAEVLLVELRQSNKFLKSSAIEHINEYLKLFSAVITEGKRQGFFREDADAALLPQAVFGAIEMISLSWLLGYRRHDVQSAARVLTATILHGIASKTH
jgi:TetR/AcrR family transcriptional regulator, fatty acid metabolism regulator protein